MSTMQMVGDIIDAGLLAEVTGDVFAGMFGEERERPHAISPTAGAYDVVSAVDISGGWHGTVSFSCELALVRFAAAELFGILADDVDEADLRDLAGEVVNVVGGNIKSLLPGPECAVASTHCAGRERTRRAPRGAGGPRVVRTPTACGRRAESCGRPLNRRGRRQPASEYLARTRGVYVCDIGPSRRLIVFSALDPATGVQPSS